MDKKYWKFKFKKSYYLFKAKIIYINKPDDTVMLSLFTSRNKSVVRRYLRKKYNAKEVYLIFID